MRRRLSCALVATACAASVGWVGAQVPAPTAAPGQPAPRRFVVIGCLTREAAPARAGGAAASRFIIIDPRGDKPTAYRLDGDEATLTLHVGHMVEASGPLSVPPPSETGPHASALVIKVSSLTYISRTCK